MRRHEGGKGLVVLPADDALLGYPHPVEERLIHQPTSVGVALQIGLVAVASFLHANPDRLFDLFEAGLSARQAGLGNGYFVRDSSLLALEQIHGYGSGVVSVEQFGALVFQLAHACFLSLALLGQLFLLL